MNRLHLAAVVYTTSAFFFLSAAQADPGAFNGRAARSFQGDRGAAAGQRAIASDGQGHVAGAAGSGFTTDSGAQGQRSRRFNRTSDGAITASGQGSASGDNGSASRSGSFNRNADGTASGDRSTTVTDANTGVTFDASTSYEKGSGVSRSASCKDAAGNTVTCGSR
jgi:hypothetical protein